MRRDSGDCLGGAIVDAKTGAFIGRLRRRLMSLAAIFRRDRNGPLALTRRVVSQLPAKIAFGLSAE